MRTWQGWLYLGAVMDLYSRRIVGWSMRPDLSAELVVDALEMAIARRRPQPGLVHHSDQGSLPGLNRSSQHRFVDLTVNNHRALPQEFASRVSFGVCCSER